VEGTPKKPRNAWVKVVILLLWLYLFLSSINMMGGGFKLMGKGFSDKLVLLTKNPFAGLMVGVLTTAIVQSSSLVTSIVVGLVGATTVDAAGHSVPILDFQLAVPVIMGANIGTTITAVLVAMGFVGRRGRFRRAFACATMHDFFNILTVATLFPLEMLFHPLSRSALWLSDRFANVTHFNSPSSPVKWLLSRLETGAHALLMDIFGLEPLPAAIIMTVVSLLLLFVSLYYLTRTIKSLVSDKMESILDRYVFRRPFIALLVGLALTATIQSSSVTTSLMVPLVTAGVLTLEQVFPYTMGANIGTTVTAVLAALGMGQPLGLAIALTHTLFNTIGVSIFFPWRRIRNIPVFLARTLAALTLRSRWYALVYILVVFFIIPCFFVFVFN